MAVGAEPGNGQDGTIRAPDLQGVLADRGIGFQAAGFTLVWFVSTTILELFEGSNFWLYQWFERATVDTYWASLVPLAALFDWIRKMFERGKAIREAKKAEIQEKARLKGLQEGRQEGLHEGRKEGLQEGRQEGLQEGLREGRRETTERIQELLKSSGVTLSPEIESAIFGDISENGS